MCDAADDVVARQPPRPSKSDAAHPPGFDPTYYTWALLFRGVLGLADDSDLKKYLQNRAIINEASDCARCEQWRDWIFQYSPTIRFLQGHIRKLGGELDETNVICRRCDTLSKTGIKQGAFSADMGILLCANHVNTRRKMEDVMAHEMVHAYDFMRFKYDKWNLRHMACTEIRANTLSSECRWSREFFGNKQLNFTRHFQDCVRRRAVYAVMTHASCKDDVQAVKVVNEVWESCFNDTRPFDEIYR